MSSTERLELFFLKSASLQMALSSSMPQRTMATADQLNDKQLQSAIGQFPSALIETAESMAEFYKLFYLLENDIRRLIDDTLTEAYGSSWWNEYAPQQVVDEVRKNQVREEELGVTSRSDKELDYTTFGQLGDIIRQNWDLFGGIISNQKALGRVMFSLNNLRGPIAHCGVLAEDEIDRLKLTVKDWFRLLEGPK